MKRIRFALILLMLLIPSLALAENDTETPAETPDVFVISLAETPATPKPIPVTLSIDNKNLYDGMTKTYSQGYSPVVSGGTATIVLPLIASGDIAGSTIIATPNLGAIAGSPFVFGNYQKTVALGPQIINGGPDTANCYYVRFDLALVPERENGVYPVIIVIEGRDAAGYDILQEFTTYVTITDGAGDPVPVEPQQPASSSNGSSGPTASKPVLVTTECMVSPNSISRGDTFDVKMLIKNVGKRTAHNVRVTIVSDDDNIILISDYSAQYLRSLPSGKEKEFAFEMQVLPMALGGIHSMSVTILYERTDNVAYAEAAAFRVNVSQPVKFSFDEIKLPEKVTSGESFTLPVCAYNTGLTNIYRLSASSALPICPFAALPAAFLLRHRYSVRLNRWSCLRSLQQCIYLCGKRPPMGSGLFQHDSPVLGDAIIFARLCPAGLPAACKQPLRLQPAHERIQRVRLDGNAGFLQVFNKIIPIHRFPQLA